MYIACFDSNLILPSCIGQKVPRIGKHKDGSALFRKVTHTKNGFAFRRQKLSSGRTLELVKYQLRQIGLDPTKYGLHSLRSQFGSCHWCDGSPNHAPLGVAIGILKE